MSVEVDEVLDVDRPGLRGIERVQLLRRDHHVPVRGDLEALHDVLVGDLLPILGADPLLLDPGVVGVVELVEPHGLLRNRAVELHGHVHEPEADCASPD